MTIPTTPLDITAEQRSNLRLLADGLEAKASQIKFDMRHFNEDDDAPSKARCGTVGCIVGNAPFLDVPAFEPLASEKYWSDYSERLFAPEGDLWDWLFSGAWPGTDNTLDGAIARIRWTLKHGLPENWWEQMYGYAPLCYVETNE